MTGFARAQGQYGASVWTWELKSVNARGLDVRCKLPPGHEALDGPVREAATKLLKRGNLSVNLSATRSGDGPTVHINEQLMLELARRMNTLQHRFPEFAAPRLDTLFAVKGVVELVEEEEDDEARDTRFSAMLGSLTHALEGLMEMRTVEGARLAGVLNGQLDEIARLTDAAAATASARPEAIRERLRTLVETLLQASPALSEERLAQEAALLVGKADVREELDRLKAHIGAARDLLAGDGSVGRKLDFLCQELNREANTLCSKSSDVELTRIGLDLKAVIEQFREQVQNIE
jgi:uncharacterized protein (TIGR00255 family)